LTWLVAVNTVLALPRSLWSLNVVQDVSSLWLKYRLQVQETEKNRAYTRFKTYAIILNYAHAQIGAVKRIQWIVLLRSDNLTNVVTCWQLLGTVVNSCSQTRQRTCLLTICTTDTSLPTSPVAMVTVSQTTKSGKWCGVSARRGPAQCRYVAMHLTHVRCFVEFGALLHSRRHYVLHVVCRPAVSLSVWYGLVSQEWQVLESSILVEILRHL